MPRSDLLAAGLATLLIALSLLPLAFAFDPLHMDPGARNARPGEYAGLPLGGDSLGRDSLARLAQALRMQLFFCALFAIATVICAALGHRTGLMRARPRNLLKTLINTALVLGSLWLGLTGLVLGRLDTTGAMIVPSVVAGYLIASSSDRPRTAALLATLPVLWGFYLSSLGLAPRPPQAMLGTLIPDHQPERPDMVWWVLVVLGLTSAAASGAAHAIARRWP